MGLAIGVVPKTYDVRPEVGGVGGAKRVSALKNPAGRGRPEEVVEIVHRPAAVEEGVFSGIAGGIGGSHNVPAVIDGKGAAGAASQRAQIGDFVEGQLGSGCQRRHAKGRNEKQNGDE